MKERDNRAASDGNLPCDAQMKPRCQCHWRSLQLIRCLAGGLSATLRLPQRHLLHLLAAQLAKCPRVHVTIKIDFVTAVLTPVAEPRRLQRLEGHHHDAARGDH